MPGSNGTRLSLVLAAAVAFSAHAAARDLIVVDGPIEAGVHRLEWEGRNDGGRHVPSGIYFLKVFTEGLSETKRVIRLH